MSLALALACLPALPRAALADDSVEVRYYFLDEAFNIWNSNSIYYEHHYELAPTAPASLTQGGNTSSLSVSKAGDGTLSGTSSLNYTGAASGITDVTASLDAAHLSAIPDLFPPTTTTSLGFSDVTNFSTNASDYYFAGWYASDAYRTTRRTLASEDETLTADEVRSYLASSEHETAHAAAFYPIYLSKSTQGILTIPVLSAGFVDSAGMERDESYVVKFNAQTNTVVSAIRRVQGFDRLAPEHGIEETPIDLTGATDSTPIADLEIDPYYHAGAWSVSAGNEKSNAYFGDWTTSADNGFWKYEAEAGKTGSPFTKGKDYKALTTTAFEGSIITKGMIEAFLRANFNKGEAIYLSDSYHGDLSAYYQIAPNAQKLIIAPSTTSPDSTKEYEFKGSAVADGTTSYNTVATLEQLQADTELGGAFATPADMKFDGWFVTKTKGEAAPASAATASGKTVVTESNLASHFDNLLKTEANETYYLYPVWLDQSLGWRSEGGHDKYYEGTKDAPVAVTGLKTIGGSSYFFNAAGELQTGWQTIAGDQYYFDPDRGAGPSKSGAAAADALRTISGKTYYFAPDGKLAKNTTVTCNGKQYCAGADGALLGGWQGTGDARRYYMADEGFAMASSRLLEIEGDGTYLFKKNGSYVKNDLARLNYFDTYAFDTEGRMVTGWRTVKETTYYFRPDTGKMANAERVDVGGDSYYFDYYGAYVKDKVIEFEDGDRYFGADGKMVKGRKVTIGGIEYTAKENGVLAFDFAGQSSGFTLGRDNNHYRHSNGSGGGFEGKKTYAISSNYFNRLTSRMSSSDRSRVQWGMNERGWGGSCYGIAATMGLTFEGKLSMNDMTRFATNRYYYMPKPCHDAKQMDTVNYYQISQYAYEYSWLSMSDKQTGKYGYAINNYKGTSSLYSFLSNLVYNPTKEPVRLLCYSIPGWCHAVLVTGVSWSAAQGKYDVQIYDMNSVGYRGGSSGGFSHMYVSPDFKTFDFVDGVGNRATEKNYHHLTVSNISNYATALPLPNGLTVGALTDAAVMQEARTLSAAALDAQEAETGNEYDATPRKHVVVTLPFKGEFTLVNAADQKLTYKDDELTGDMVVYAFNPIANEDESLMEIETDESTFTLSTGDATIDVTVSSENGFVALQAQGANGAMLNVADGTIDVVGANGTYNAGVLTEANAKGDLVGVKGSFSKDLKIERQGKAGLNVSSTGTLNNLTATRYDGALTNTVDIATVGKSATVNAETDFVDANAKAGDLAVDDLSDNGPETAPTPDTADTPDTAGTPASPTDVDDPAVRYPEDRDYWVDKGDGTEAGAHWYVYRKGALRTNCWVWLDGAWYYLGSDGEMLVGKQTLDFLGEGGTYFFNPAHDGSYGRMRTGWFYDAGHWYYMYRESDHRVAGMVATGWQWTDGAWYHFDPEGKMTVGWLWDAGTWYYLADDGHMIRSGWALDGGKWYWFNENGALVKNAWIWDGNAWYWAGDSGAAEL